LRMNRLHHGVALGLRMNRLHHGVALGLRMYLCRVALSLRMNLCDSWELSFGVCE
jgi:hypothetical protein